MVENQSLTRGQKLKKVLPKVLPLLLLSVILPTFDIGSDLALITDLYTGITACVESTVASLDRKELRKCKDIGPDQYCTLEKVSNGKTLSVF